MASLSPAAGTPAPEGAWFVLVGGEGASLQGGPYESREFMHTSVSFVGEAYASLRRAGVPADRIITIAQLDDYVSYLRAGVSESIPDQQVPGRYYQEQLDRTSASCAQWLAESGGAADYDRELVNPATFVRVLTGKGVPGATSDKVVPADSAAPVFFGVYSHGDSHAAKTEGGAAAAAGGAVPHTYTSAEWYIHFPFEAPRDVDDMYDFVATDGQKGHRCLLYATQIRLALHALASADPGHSKRPVVGLLNCCRSGGILEFMRRPSAVQPDLPLFLMSSSGAGTDSLVSGFWTAWFNEFHDTLVRKGTTTLPELFASAERRHYRENKYEALNHLKEAAFSYEIWKSEFEFTGARPGNVDPWHLDLTAALARAWEADPPTGAAGEGDDGDGCGPDWSALRELQEAYASGRAYRVTTKASANRPTYLVQRDGGVTERVPFEGAAQLDDGRWVLWARSRQHLGERHLSSSGKRRLPSPPPRPAASYKKFDLAGAGLAFEGDELAPGLATLPYPVSITAWKGPNEGQPVDLVQAVERIYATHIAIPGEAHNDDIEERDVAGMFAGGGGVV